MPWHRGSSVSAGLHVFSTYGRLAASPRIRALRWTELLGVSAEIHTYLGRSTAGPRDIAAHPVRTLRAERHLRSCLGLDRVFVSREVSPLSTGVVESRILGTAGLGVYDLDDGFPWDTAGSVRRLVPKAAKAERAARSATRVVVANQVLADWASDFTDDVTVIPSCVQPSDYTVKTDHAVAERPVIGWIGSRWTLPYVRALAPALLRIHAETGARLELVGAGTGPVGALDEMVDRIAWSEEVETSRPARWDVAIAPLRHGAFERARSSYKLVQYAAAGVPAVGSRWGATADVVAAIGARGADSVDEWYHQLHELLSASVADRAALAGAQRSAVEQHFSYSAWAGEWRRVTGE